MNDPRSPEPRTTAGKRLLDFLTPTGLSTPAWIGEHIAAIEAEASSSDELRAALTQALNYFEMGAGDYYRLYGNNDDPVDVLRAALSSKPSAEPARPYDYETEGFGGT